MPLSHVWTWTAEHPLGLALAILGAAIFAGLYATARTGAWRVEQARLNRIHTSLMLYTSAAGGLLQAIESNCERADFEELLTQRLQACRAAPYLSADMQGQIGAYLADGDNTRLPLLLRSLEREISRLQEEQAKLLLRSERPSWGLSLWLQLRPALPFAFAAAAVLWTAWLVQALEAAPAADGSTAAWQLAAIWSRFVSCLFSLLLLYPVLLENRRRTERTPLVYVLSIGIALLAFVHFVGLTLAPYILTVQLLLWLLGFRLNEHTPRKTRPFAGHYDSPTESITNELPMEQLPEHEDGKTQEPHNK
ncbi:hypothetical protein J2Z69_002657 [Paenibacillus shirakamiensis]|uniref:DUF4239 domain-containing protein n=1 Tax=Paenibacillus shirakamiensis TaxID=1265935 RepID=A0ABS4JIU2_9BACL|nr:hypothetical protein [Paenibacillus shirakamiensis]MBP2001612.1 hypothetical protein [Paenibacillus shirakamiensis]